MDIQDQIIALELEILAEKWQQQSSVPYQEYQEIRHPPKALLPQHGIYDPRPSLPPSLHLPFRAPRPYLPPSQSSLGAAAALAAACPSDPLAFALIMKLKETSKRRGDLLRQQQRLARQQRSGIHPSSRMKHHDTQAMLHILLEKMEKILENRGPATSVNLASLSSSLPSSSKGIVHEPEPPSSTNKVSKKITFQKDAGGGKSSPVGFIDQPLNTSLVGSTAAEGGGRPSLRKKTITKPDEALEMELTTLLRQGSSLDEADFDRRAGNHEEEDTGIRRSSSSDETDSFGAGKSLKFQGPLAIRSPKSTRNKTNKNRMSMRTSMMGFLGLGNFFDGAKPRWRYQNDGEAVPTDDTLVLKGAKLFRAVSIAIRFFVWPQLIIHKRKLANKEQEAAEFASAFPLYMEQCKTWVSKTTKTTITSILQDEHLDLDLQSKTISILPTLSSSGGGGRKHKNSLVQSKLVQLKVRVKSILTNLCSETVPSTVSHVLASMFSEGVYYPAGFLFESEEERLDFSPLGATRNMVPSAAEDSKPSDLQHIHEYEDLGKCDVSHLSMLLTNLLVVRILIDQILLSTRARSDVTSKNLKMVASILYLFAEMVQPDLLPFNNKPIHAQQLRQPRFSLFKKKVDNTAADGTAPATPLPSVSSSLFGGGGRRQSSGPGSNRRTSSQAGGAGTQEESSKPPVSPLFVTNANIVAKLTLVDDEMLKELEIWLQPYKSMLEEWLARNIEQIIGRKRIVAKE